MKVLILKLEGPLMSFGTVAIDEIRPTSKHPLKSMLAGMLANAIGYRRNCPAEIQHLQDSIMIASRLDRPGSHLRDFQTAYLGKGGNDDEMKTFCDMRSWSSRGYLMGRTFSGTFPMTKEYRADASVTVAISAVDAELLDICIQASRRPQRPVFLGRKSCLPSRPIYQDTMDCQDVMSALLEYPIDGCDGDIVTMSIQWPRELGSRSSCETRLTVHDLRDWANGVHAGSREVLEADFVMGK